MLTTSIIDLEKLRVLADGEEDFVLEVLDLFVKNTPKELAKIETAIQNKDFKRAGEIIHKLKPNLRLLGLKTIEQEILQMEHNGLNEKDIDSIPLLYDKIKVVCWQAIAEIEHIKTPGS